MLHRVLIFCFLLVFHLSAIAQIDDCEVILNNATDEFNAGHFYNITALLKPCIDHGFSKEQRQRAYLLLTQTYLLLDDPIGAESSYLELLKANPEFKTDPDRDPIDVVYLSKKFTASPVFSLFGKIGGNTSPVTMTKEINITGEPINNQYILKPGWTLGIGINWHFSEKFSLTLEVQYAQTAYRRTQSGLFDGYSSTDLVDQQNWVNFPITLRYTHPWDKKLVPYAYAGLSGNYLLDANANLILTDSDPFNITESPIIPYKQKRKIFNQSLILGLGLKYKYGLNYVYGDIGYAMGVSNLFKYEGAYIDYDLDNSPTSDKVLDSGSPGFRFASIDNFFKLNTIHITVGFVKPIYKPRKIKKPKTGLVLRMIRKMKK